MQEKEINKNHRKWIVALFMIGTFVTVLNQTALITAIPQIMVTYHITADTAQWLTTAYLLINGILIPVTAFLTEKYTTRQLFITAMSVFIVGTFLAAISNSFSLLLFARIIQACGPGITLPLMQTVFFRLYPKEKRGSIMGLAGLVVGFAPAIGPSLSGAIIDYLSWKYIFLMVLPISIVVLVLGIVYMKNVGETNSDRKVDLLSVVLSTIGFGAILFGTSIAGSAHRNNLLLIIVFLVGIIGLIVFIRRQLNLETPMLEFRVFKYTTFTLTTLIAIITLVSSIGVETILPIYIQNIRNMSAMQSGLVLLPGAIITAVASLIAGKLVDKIGGKIIAVWGFIIITLATIPFVFLKTNTAIWFIVVFYAIRLAGISAIMMPVTTVGLNALPSNLLSHGTAMNNTFRQVGGSIGTALLVTIYSTTSTRLIEKGTVTNQAIAQVLGMNITFVVVTIFAFAGVIISLFLKKKS